MGAAVIRTAVSVVLTIAAAALHAGQNSPHGFAGRSGSGSAAVVTDLDRDGRADTAILLGVVESGASSSLRLELHFSSQPHATIPLDTFDPDHSLAASDVDDDRDADLIIERPFTHQRVRVLLNDGTGHFAEGTAPDRQAPDPSSERLSGPLEGMSGPSVWRAGYRSKIAALRPAVRSGTPVLVGVESTATTALFLADPLRLRRSPRGPPLSPSC